MSASVTFSFLAGSVEGRPQAGPSASICPPACSDASEAGVMSAFAQLFERGGEMDASDRTFSFRGFSLQAANVSDDSFIAGEKDMDLLALLQMSLEMAQTYLQAFRPGEDAGSAVDAAGRTSDMSLDALSERLDRLQDRLASGLESLGIPGQALKPHGETMDESIDEAWLQNVSERGASPWNQSLDRLRQDLQGLRQQMEGQSSGSPGASADVRGDEFFSSLKQFVESARQLIQQLHQSAPAGDRSADSGQARAQAHGAALFEVLSAMERKPGAPHGRSAPSATSLFAVSAALSDETAFAQSFRIDGMGRGANGDGPAGGEILNKEAAPVEAEPSGERGAFAPFGARTGMTDDVPEMSAVRGASLSSANAASGTMQSMPSIALPLRHPDWSQALAQRVMVMVQQGQQQADIRLHPAHLGPIRVRLQMDEEGVQVSLQAHHALTREAMEQALPRLRTLFDAQQVPLFGVSVENQGSFSGQMRQQKDDRATDSLASSMGHRPDLTVDTENGADHAVEDGRRIGTNRLVSHVV